MVDDKEIRLNLQVQENLPTQPIPELDETLKIFLETKKVVCSSQEYDRIEKLVKDFGKKGGDGEKLQSELKKKMFNSPDLIDQCYKNKGYLSKREPLPMWSNPSVGHLLQQFDSQDDQLSFAANVTTGILHIKNMLDSNTFPADTVGARPHCLNQVKNVLSTCRVPGKENDKVFISPRKSSTHVTVMHNGNIYIMDVYNNEGNAISNCEIKTQLQYIVNLTDDSSLPIGIFTTCDRDMWSEIYEKLSEDEENKANLQKIQSSIFMLCLDKPFLSTDSAQIEAAILDQISHGGGSSENGCNRWYDKTLQVIVSRDGVFGSNREHTLVDGAGVAVFNKHLHPYCTKSLPVAMNPYRTTEKIKVPSKLHFKTYKGICEDIEKAKNLFDSYALDTDIKVVEFHEYGKEFIKSQKLSPDAFIQIILQLVLFRMYGGKPQPNSENVSQRRYKYGRQDFVMYEVLSNTGVEIHLQLLDDVATDAGGEKHQLLTDDDIEKWCYDRMSTSQTPESTTGNDFSMYGPDFYTSYTVDYKIPKDSLKFIVGSWKSCKETDTMEFINLLFTALNETKQVLLKSSVKSTL